MIEVSVTDLYITVFYQNDANTRYDSIDSTLHDLLKRHWEELNAVFCRQHGNRYQCDQYQLSNQGGCAAKISLIWI